ncbi:hypothetical protein C8R46DRAFT_295560 [Mycena filopes]|nr:hypothetical protein C8R46DRAFT_295560 [Mycena filopes]
MIKAMCSLRFHRRRLTPSIPTFDWLAESRHQHFCSVAADAADPSLVHPPTATYFSARGTPLRQPGARLRQAARSKVTQPRYRRQSGRGQRDAELSACSNRYRCIPRRRRSAACACQTSTEFLCGSFDRARMVMGTRSIHFVPHQVQFDAARYETPHIQVCAMCSERKKHAVPVGFMRRFPESKYHLSVTRRRLGSGICTGICALPEGNHPSDRTLSSPFKKRN